MTALSLPFLHGLRPLGVLILRLVTGLVFVAHGLPKLRSYGTGEGWLTGGMVANLGLPMPELFAWAVVIAEVVGGTLLVLGLLTRIWGLLNSVDMFVAGLLVQLRNPEAEPTFAFFFGDRGELELMLMAASLALLFLGPGAWSLDRLLGIEREPRT